MRLRILSLIMMLCTTLGVMAQMSDSQVINFVMKEQKAGTSQAQIVTKLMQKGVNIEQIRRIRKQYQRSKGDALGQVKTDNDAEQPEGRLRKNNGDEKQKAGNSQMLRNNNDYIHTYDKNDMDYMNMRSEMQTTFRDSMTIDEEEEYQEWLESKNKKKVFGRDIFNKKNLTFEPAMNIATPQNYRLGPGDAVYIDVYGASQKTIEQTISPDGTVTVEGYGPISISGLTVDQANARIRQTLGTRYSNSKLKLTVGQTRTIMVNVMGEVKTPGTYTVSAFATVFHALYMAGGISDIGTLRNIKVFRQGRMVTSVDVYDYILNGKLTGNIRLVDNDVIVVGPYDCLVTIDGKVKRPMIYEMKRSESIQSLLKYAGGFANDAYKESVRVLRKTGRQYSVHNVTEFDMSSFYMEDGDSVSVDSILNRYENTVEIKGAVFRPGLYQLGGDITSVRTLLESAEGVTEEAFTARAVMHRMKKDRTLEVLPVDIAGIMDGRVADIPLRNEDVLFIPSLGRAYKEQTITIHGEVQFPGVYKYADNETLEDFVLQAGGLKESASVMKVDVARREINPKATATDSLIAHTYSFQLKEGFVIDGEPGFKLQPFDHVYVRKSPGYTKQQNVTVEGNVMFEGTYTLAKRDTRLSDIIKSAGGFDDMAYVKGARLERRLTDDERMRMESMLKMARNNSGAKDSLDIKKLDIGETYFVGIDLEQAMKHPGGKFDILMREGDRLIVPEYNATVKINGAVMYPNTVSYQENRSVSWYIKRAGGYGNTAKKRNTYIIHQNGMVEKVDHSTKVTPGCEIVVPEKAKKDTNAMQTTSMVVSAASTLATVGAVVISAIK